MNYIDDLALKIEHELPVQLRPDDHSTELYRLYGLLVLLKGEHCTLQDVHDAWSAWMTPQQPHHKALIPFPNLTAEQQEQDRPYLDAIQRVAKQEFRDPSGS